MQSAQSVVEMECNKGEAIWAKEIAEKKLTECDITGAKIFASRAKNLFPELEGLSQFLEILDVYISAEKKVNGYVDWYEVLRVDPLADDETISRQYRKLALPLRPDKNKSVGADGAFKILTDAWILLSDKAKRTAHDQKRNVGAVYQKGMTGNASAPPGKNGFHFFTGNSPGGRHQASSSNPQPAPPPPWSSKPNTFWTSCNGCKMQYEYLKDYINRYILCPKCQAPFLATEMPLLSTTGHHSSTSCASYMLQQNGRHYFANNNLPALGRELASVPRVGMQLFTGVGSFNNADLHLDPFTGSGGVTSQPASAAQTSHAVQSLKRGHEEAQEATAVDGETMQRKTTASKKTDVGSRLGKGNRLMKKRCMDENKCNNNRKETLNQMEMGNVVGGQGNQSTYQKGGPGAEGVGVCRNIKQKTSEDLSQLEIRSMLMAKARMEIRKMLVEWSIAATTKASHERGMDVEKKPKTAVNGVQKTTARKLGKGGNMNNACADAKNPVEHKKSSPAIGTVVSDASNAEIVKMSVPDPDFHDFDKDRTEKSFGGNQVWAAYDDEDGMPRYYALIHDVISTKPFEMRISWLNSKSNSEFGPLNWVGSGFPKTSGDFRVGKHEINMALNSFSHRVMWTKGAKGVIQIFPRKGDVWALYRNWSPDWNELTPDEVIHKYNVVELLEDYNEDQGVTVAPLVKVAGFKSVFHQHSNLSEIWTIPREEMFRFSHKVPSYLLTGKEASNAPKGYQELDPAAMPLELLQVITEANEAMTKADTEKATEDQCNQKVKEELHWAESADKAKEKGLLGDTVGTEAVMQNANETQRKERVEETNEAKGEARMAHVK